MGPFNVPSGPGTVTQQYALASASGTRTFVSGSTVQTVNITGVDGEDGADFRVYSASPYLDDAGVTLTAARPPYFYTGTAVDTTSTDSYVNLWWTTNGLAIQEANYQDGSNYITLSYAIKGSNPAIDNYQCPASTVAASPHS